jgi:hypothetical protein
MRLAFMAGADTGYVPYRAVKRRRRSYGYDSYKAQPPWPHEACIKKYGYSNDHSYYTIESAYVLFHNIFIFHKNDRLWFVPV